MPMKIFRSNHVDLPMSAKKKRVTNRCMMIVELTKSSGRRWCRVIRRGRDAGCDLSWIDPCVYIGRVGRWSLDKSGKDPWLTWGEQNDGRLSAEEVPYFFPIVSVVSKR